MVRTQPPHRDHERHCVAKKGNRKHPLSLSLHSHTTTPHHTKFYADIPSPIQGKSLHSLVPVILNETGDDLDVVIASLVELLRITGENIDKNAHRLFALTEHDAEERASVEAYLMAYWTNMTGSYWWS